MPNPDYSLRPATDKDYDFLYQLHVLTMKAPVEAIWGWNEEFQTLLFQSQWDPSRRQIVVIDGVAAGTVTLEERPDSIFLGLIEIHPDYQGQGIGAAIIRDILADAFGRGLDVVLRVLKSNPRAKRLYDRLGFVIAEEHEERYIMRAFCPHSNNSELQGG